MINNKTGKTDIVDVIALLKKGQHRQAFHVLSRIAAKTDNSVLQARYARILSSLDQGTLKDLPPIKIAVLASTTVNFFCDILGFWLSLAGFKATFFHAAYDTIAQTILNPDSELYQFNPDIIWIFTSFRDIKIPIQFKRPQDLVLQDIDAVVREYAALWNTLQKRCHAYIIQNNADLPPYRTLGNYDGIADWSRSNILRHYNSRLAGALPEGVTVFDLEYVSSFFGKEKWFELTQWYNSKIAFNLDAAGEVAYQGSQLIAAIKGRAKKCLVLDLDNTLWGGIIGESGLEGILLGDGPIGEVFVDFQKYILELKNRGIILAVCSKNDEEKAKEPFLKHPSMQLKLEDIAVFKANWGNKADNLKEISGILNIGLDSIVFVDDDPAERELVSTFLPQVAVPILPDDPADYQQALDQYRYFELIGTSIEDGKRTEYYYNNIARDSLRKDFFDLAGYLKNLQMEATIGSFDDFHLPRIVQLINKSNQFHLTTTRYSLEEVRNLRHDPNTICLHFSLKDKFGDNGLIAAVILKKIPGDTYVIDTWCMSCRVLSRGMEEFICQTIIELGLEKAVKRIVGIYIPTAKNKLVADLYPRLGFNPLLVVQNETSSWQLGLDKDYQKHTTYIKACKQ